MERQIESRNPRATLDQSRALVEKQLREVKGRRAELASIADPVQRRMREVELDREVDALHERREAIADAERHYQESRRWQQ
jgi:hypothetical protein